MGRKKNDALVF